MTSPIIGAGKAAEKGEDPDAIPGTICPERSRPFVIPVQDKFGMGVQTLMTNVNCSRKCPLFDGMETVQLPGDTVDPVRRPICGLRGPKRSVIG